MKPLAVRAAYVCAWIYTAAHFVSTGIRQPLRSFYGDFLASFPSWRIASLLGRLDLYNGSLARYWARKFGSDAVWHYGPVMHAVTLPLYAFPDLRAAYVAWLFASYAFLAIALWLLTRELELGPARWIALLAALNFVPLYEALTQRNIEIFEMVLIVAAFAVLRRKRLAAAGVLIGVAAMTKFLPLIFLPYFAVKRMWRALAAAAITIVPIAVAAQFVLGWEHSGILIQLRRGGFLNSVMNQSVSGAVIRILDWTHSSLPAPLLSRIAIVVALIALSWLFVTLRRCEGIEDLEWAMLITAMVLLPPHNQQYYFILLIFPFFALLARGLYPWWLAATYALVGAPLPFRLLGPQAFQSYLLAGIPFLGAAILAVLCARALRHVPCT